MKTVAPGEDEEISVIDMIEAAFAEPREETPLERYRRTGKKLPPPNNPRTPEGRKWIAKNLNKAERTDKKSRRRRKKKGAPG